jgi:hypothetical protein
VLGVLVNVLLFSPLAGILLAISSRSIVFRLRLSINRSDQGFLEYYNRGRYTRTVYYPFRGEKRC